MNLVAVPFTLGDSRVFFFQMLPLRVSCRYLNRFGHLSYFNALRVDANLHEELSQLLPPSKAFDFYEPSALSPSDREHLGRD